VCEKAFGLRSEDWTGQRATLYVDPSVSFKGQIVGGLRLRPMKSTKATKPAKASKPSPLVEPKPDDSFDDEIP
jgi:hypothetical protein